MSKIRPGTYAATCVLPRIAEQLFTTSNSGKDGLHLDFVLADGREISTTLWLSANAITRTLETLQNVFKFDGDFTALARGEGFPNYECSLVIENESFAGRDGVERVTPKIKWINSRGGSRPPADVGGVLSRLSQLTGETFAAPAGPEQTEAAAGSAGSYKEELDDDSIPF